MTQISDYTYTLDPPIIFTRPAADLTNYQVKVIIQNGTGMYDSLTHAVNIPTGECKADFSDVRFSDGVTIHNTWLEYVDVTKAIFWVKVPIIQSGTYTKMYVHWGNPAKTYQGLPITSTFLSGVDPAGGSVGNWVTKGAMSSNLALTISGGMIQLARTGASYSNNSIYDNTVTLPTDAFAVHARVVYGGTTPSIGLVAITGTSGHAMYSPGTAMAGYEFSSLAATYWAGGGVSTYTPTAPSTGSWEMNLIRLGKQIQCRFQPYGSISLRDFDFWEADHLPVSNYDTISVLSSATFGQDVEKTSKISVLSSASITQV